MSDKEKLFNGLRYIVRSGMQWRMIPNDLPPWHTVYQQTQRWLRADVVYHDDKKCRYRYSYHR